jgi:hypothetical protein
MAGSSPTGFAPAYQIVGEEDQHEIVVPNWPEIALMSFVKQQHKRSPFQLASVGSSSSDDRAGAGAKR